MSGSLFTPISVKQFLVVKGPWYQKIFLSKVYILKINVFIWKNICLSPILLNVFLRMLIPLILGQLRNNCVSIVINLCSLKETVATLPIFCTVTLSTYHCVYHFIRITSSLSHMESRPHFDFIIC